MNRIRECINVLKERKDWSGVSEVENYFDYMLKVADDVEKDQANARHKQGNIIVSLRTEVQNLEKKNKKLEHMVKNLKGRCLI